MAYPPKPAGYIDWTDGDPSKVVEPSNGKKLSGWQSAEKPPFQYMNWLFFRLNEWLVYEDQTLDLLKSQVKSLYDVVVDGTVYNDLNEVMADPNVSQGSRILVANNQTLSTIQQVTKNNLIIDFAPGVTWQNGGSGTGIQITASGTRFKGARLINFTTAVQIDMTSNYTVLADIRFAGNTFDVVDNNGKGTSYGLITE